MKNKKINLDMLENANSEILEQLSDEDKLSDAEKDRMFEMSIKYYYGEMSDDTKSKKVDMQAEVKNKAFFRKNTAAAAVLFIILINAVLIGALKSKNGGGITEYGDGHDQVVSSVTSDTEKENIIIHTDAEITSLNKKSSLQNTKKETTAVTKQGIENINSISVTETEKIQEICTTVPFNKNEEQIQTSKTEDSQAVSVTTEPEAGISEKEPEDPASEVIDTDMLVRILNSQKYTFPSDTVKSDYSFSPDENTTYFIEQSGLVWKYDKTADKNENVEEARLSKEDYEIVNKYFQTYGKRIFKIYPIDTDYLAMKLNSLSYSAPANNGVPKYSFSPDGLIRYEIDLESRLVWRICTDQNGETVTEEAELTVDVYSAAEKCIAFYGDSVFSLV